MGRWERRTNATVARGQRIRPAPGMQTSDFRRRPAPPVQAAYDIARFTRGCGCGAAHDGAWLGRPTRCPSADLFHPWSIDAAGGGRMALRCEAGTLGSPRIPTARARGLGAEGTLLGRNSRGFRGATPVRVTTCRCRRSPARAGRCRGRMVQLRARASELAVAQRSALRAERALVRAGVAPGHRRGAGLSRRRGRGCSARRAGDLGRAMYARHLMDARWAIGVRRHTMSTRPHRIKGGSEPFDDDGVRRGRGGSSSRRRAGIFPAALGAQARNADHCHAGGSHNRRYSPARPRRRPRREARQIEQRLFVPAWGRE